ncbi:ABC transporter permease [Tessaracoccus massiliensis]|uniref:ABC transporter permease n=1 Tax=Tessaracoccus massiliensis TaxID=1522311 RepID=UPI00058EB6BE|nr:ABC transporter permease [Tessaracoccus massiliensis]
MISYLARRLGFLLLSFVLAMLAIFVLLRLLPGDPANALLSIDATPEQIEAAQDQVGSNLPIWQQLLVWLGEVMRLDLGESFISGTEVLPEIVQRLGVTIPLTLIAFTLSLLVASFVGYFAATQAHTRLGVLLSGLSQVGIAVPVFWIGILLVWILALQLRLFPSGSFPRDGWADPAGALRSLTLPVLTIVAVMSASLTRYVRSATLDVLDSDYLRFARALGAGRGEAFVAHGLRNASVPVISILGIELASTLLGAVVVESVFTLPGLGSMLTKGIEQHDYPSIQGVLLVTTFFVLIIGFLADVAQRLVDPRLRTTLSGADA